MSDVIEFEIPLEPQSKLRPRFGGKFTYTPAKTRKYEQDLYLLAKKYAPQILWNCPMKFTATFFVQPPKTLTNKRSWEKGFRDYHPTPKPDLDNYLKAVLDAFNKVFWHDDSYVVEIHAFKKYAHDQPKIAVKIEKIGPLELKACVNNSNQPILEK